MIDEEYLMYAKRVEYHFEKLAQFIERCKVQEIELEKYKNHELYYSMWRSENRQNLSYVSILSIELIHCLRALRDKAENND